MLNPNISVIIPVYNGGPYLKEAIESVYKQQLDGIEIIVIDDGSTDGCCDPFANMRDPRFILVRQENKGLAFTLNCGLTLSKGKYISRLDQDDIMLPGRLIKQSKFLDDNPGVAMVGTWASIYEGDCPSGRQHRHPRSHDALFLELLFDNPFVHSSVMIRAEVIKSLGGYSEDASREPPEDYELWSRIARFYEVANLPEELTVYREFPSSMSRSSATPFLDKIVKISSENLANLLTCVPEEHCMFLALTYHYSKTYGLVSSIGFFRVQSILEAISIKIAGPPSTWSEEYRVSHKKITRRLMLGLMHNFIPAPLMRLLLTFKEWVA